MRSPSLIGLLTSSLFCGLTLAACGGDSGPGPVPLEGPVYVGATRVFTDNGSSGYLFAVSTLGETGEVDLARSREIDDAWVFGDADPYFYTATIFSPTITRWSIEGDQFVEGPTVSFANEGVGGTYTAAFTPIYAADKSYFADGDSMQVVVWDPSSMTFLRTIDLGVADMPGYFPWVELAVRENDIVASIYFQSEDLISFGDFVRTVVIDPATDTIVEEHDDDRCQSIGLAGVASDGTAYYSAVDYNSTIRHVFGEEFGADSCALRVNGDAHVPDDTFTVDLSSLVGGLTAGSAYLVSDDELLFHVWDPALVDATPSSWVDDRFEPGYKWYRWQIGDTEAVALPDQEPSSEGGTFRTIDGEVYAFSANSEYSETMVSRFEDDGRFTNGLVVPGWIVTMIRAR